MHLSKYLPLLLALTIALSCGCASRPSDAKAQPAVRRSMSSTTEPAVRRSLAAPVRAQWKTTATAGSRLATLDGVTIWMSQPATGNPAKPSAIDMKTFFDPVLSGRTSPLARGRQQRIMLDPGHGGHDPGAISGSLRESVITLDIATKTAELLRKAGYQVQLTRTGDDFIDLERRDTLAAQWKADLFVSIHLNSAASAGAAGIETYFIPPVTMRTTQQSAGGPPYEEPLWMQKNYPGNAHPEENMRLAFCVHRRTGAAAQLTDRGIKTARFAVLRSATMPAILVECGFISNSNNAALLAAPEGRDRIARGIASGIQDFAQGAIAPTR